MPIKGLASHDRPDSTPAAGSNPWLRRQARLPSHPGLQQIIIDAAPWALVIPEGGKKLSTLAREADPEIQALGLLRLGRELLDQNRIEPALTLFSQLEGELSKGREPWSGPLTHSARRAREAISGHGHWGERSEFFISQFTATATDPISVASFGAGALVADGVKLWSLSRLAAASPSLMIRGWRVERLASSFAFAAELVSLTALRAGLNAALGRDSSSAVEREIASNFILLGALRLTGSLVGRGLPRRPELVRLPTLHQGAMLGGILLGQGLEAAVGLRAPADPAMLLGDALAFLIQAQVGAHLGKKIFGQPLAPWITGMREALRSPWRGSSDAELWGPQRAWAIASGGGGRPPRTDRRWPGARLPNLVFSQGGGEGAEGSFLHRRLAQRLRADLSKGLKLSPEALKPILEHFQKTRFAVDPDGMLNRYYQLLSHVRVDTAFGEEGSLPREKVLERAVHAFQHVTALNTVNTTTGSLYEHLLQIALERTVTGAEQAEFNELVRLAALERTLQGLEIFLGKGPPPPSYPPSKPMLDWELRLASIPLPQAAKGQISGYLKALAHGHFSQAPGHSISREAHGEEAELHWGLDKALSALQDRVLTLVPNSPPIRSLIAALSQAGQSPVPHLVVERILKVLAADGLSEKIDEVGPWEAIDLPAMREAKVFNPLTDNFTAAGRRLNGGIYTGFVDDLPLAWKVARFYSLLDIYLKPENQRLHLGQTVEYARQRLKERETTEHAQGNTGAPANYNKEDILELLYHRNTPLAAEARTAIIRGDVDLLVRSREDMDLLWKSLPHAGKDLAAPKAFFIDPDRSPLGIPLIALRELDPALSPEEKARQAVNLGGRVTHEYEHFLHHRELSFNTRAGRLRAEMRALLEELHYYLAHGYVGEWERVQQLSPYGLGMYLRNRVEQDYLVGSPDLIKDT